MPNCPMPKATFIELGIYKQAGKTGVNSIVPLRWDGGPLQVMNSPKYPSSNFAGFSVKTLAYT